MKLVFKSTDARQPEDLRLTLELLDRHREAIIRIADTSNDTSSTRRCTLSVSNAKYLALALNYWADRQEEVENAG